MQTFWLAFEIFRLMIWGFWYSGFVFWIWGGFRFLKFGNWLKIEVEQIFLDDLYIEIGNESSKPEMTHRNWK